MVASVFDLVLCLTLVWLAWHVLAGTETFRAVVLFISFGLLMALAWVRLQAPDVALAEAAIGSGLTGALFLSALRRLTSGRRGERRVDREEARHDAGS